MHDRTVLFCSDDDKLGQGLRAVGFQPVPVGSGWVDVLDREEHLVVVVGEGADPEALGYLRGLSGARRRDLYIVRVDDGGATGDMSQAWRQSVDLLVHPADLPRLESLIDDGVEAKRLFYARFRELARAQGDA